MYGWKDVSVKELYLNNLHTLPCFFPIAASKSLGDARITCVFFLHSKKHPAEIAQVIFRQFLSPART